METHELGLIKEAILLLKVKKSHSLFLSFLFVTKKSRIFFLTINVLFFLFVFFVHQIFIYG